MQFAPLDDRPGLSVFDPIEGVRFELYAAAPVEPTPTATDEFYFPVDSAVAVETTEVEIPKLVSVVVREPDGTMVTEAATDAEQTLDAGDYLLELQSTPMKLYLRASGPLTFTPGESSVTLGLDGERQIRVGARSFHDKPAGTITVTDDVEDAVRALSLLGSALKTTSCERSFPTLRGHPPLIELGEEFDVPDAIEPPETGVEIVLPPDREYLYPAASLAYYLGAAVVTGSEPRLVAEGFEHSLDGPDGYEATVNRTLRQVFFCDCLTRTEGYYQVDLHEREQVEPLVDLDFADLYGRSVAEQVEAYLSVPFETIEPHVMDWHLTADVVPTAENLPALPHFADDVALLRTPENPQRQTLEATPEVVEDFTRRATPAGDFTRGATAGGPRTPGTSEGATRSASDAWDWDDDDIFQVDPAETVEHAWVGPGYPVGANKVTLDALAREAERTPPDQSAITVHVVCNDQEMAEENVVSEFYGLRDLIEYDVSFHEETTAAELAALFEQSADFLHYIGHVDANGFRCADGYLDAASLGTVNVDAFLLNACHSYRQGETLVEKGSRGGVVTLAEVINSSATTVGRSLARLLNSGFNLRSALSIAKGEVLASTEYLTVGDGGLTLCQSDSGVPILHKIRDRSEGYELEMTAFPTASHGLGTIFKSNIYAMKRSYLAFGPIDRFHFSKGEIIPVLELELLPVKFNNSIYWSDTLSQDEF